MTSSISGEAIDADHDPRRQRLWDGGRSAAAGCMPQRAHHAASSPLLGTVVAISRQMSLGDASDQIVLSPPTARERALFDAAPQGQPEEFVRLCEGDEVAPAYLVDLDLRDSHH